jgi:hypothetical protein
VFLPGGRPDVEKLFPTLRLADRAARVCRVHVLSNPREPMQLHLLVTDVEWPVTDLGARVPTPATQVVGSHRSHPRGARTPGAIFCRRRAEFYLLLTEVREPPSDR